MSEEIAEAAGLIEEIARLRADNLDTILLAVPSLHLLYFLAYHQFSEILIG